MYPRSRDRLLFQQAECRSASYLAATTFSVARPINVGNVAGAPRLLDACDATEFCATVTESATGSAL
jgi:hypothetical protein